MTNPTGRSFLSYSAGDAAAAERLIQAQRELGIPTWRDVDDLEIGPIPDNLREELQSPETADAILWITEKSLRSDWILRLELEEITRRVERNDGFFFLPVAAGMSREQAVDGLRPHFGLGDPSVHTVEESPDPVPSAAEAQRIALKVLDQRVRAIDARLPAGEPLVLRLLTWPAATTGSAPALVLDWRHRFGDGHGRLAKLECWTEILLPSLLRVRNTLSRRAGHRRIQASGNCTIPSAAALGVTFLSLQPLHVSWMQPESPPLVFSLDEPSSPVDLLIRTEEGNPSATDLAVLLSVAQPARPGFLASRSELPAFRAIVEVSADSGSFRITEPGQATTIARRTIEAILEAKGSFGPLPQIHWFAAVPVGLAMLLGQLFNTLPSNQMYEYLEEGRYVRSAVLRAGR